MEKTVDFADTIHQFVSRSGYTAGQLARLTGIPKPTILSWLDGRVKHPRSYSDLIKLAETLKLSAYEIGYLLRSAGFNEVAARIEQNLTSQTDKGQQSAVLSPPFQAIPALPYFVGRQALIHQIEEILLTDPAYRACCLHGMAGVGKTALATQMAYRLRPHFPDGVLWANSQRSTPMTILSTFGRAFGEDVSQYPDLESRSQVVRQLLANKAVLLVLDDVWHGQDVLPLLPPSTGKTAVIVTTRRLDLFATVGMHRLEVGPFDTSQQVSLQLFGRFLAEDLTTAKASTLSEISDLLGHLPLAVAIAASRLAYEPSWTPEAFLERLHQTRQQLAELEFEDQSVQISFAASYALLEPKLQTFFSLMGVFEAREFTPAAAAAVAQIPQRQAEDFLRKLYALSLCQLGRGDAPQARFRLHPLLSQYAEETAVALDHLPQAHYRLINYFVDYGEKHQGNHQRLALEANNATAVLSLAKKYSLHDAHQRIMAAYTAVIGQQPLPH